MQGCSCGVRLVRQPEVDLLALLVDFEEFVQSFLMLCGEVCDIKPRQSNCRPANKELKATKALL